MKNFTLILCLHFIMTLFTSNTYAQKEKQVWEISAYTNQPNMGAVLDTVSNDTLYVYAFNNHFGIEIDSIKYLKKIEAPKRYISLGMFVGVLGGGILGNRIADNSASDKGILGGVSKGFYQIIGTGAGIIIGGIFGAAAGAGLDHPKYITFKDKSFEQKVAILLKLINEH